MKRIASVILLLSCSIACTSLPEPPPEYHFNSRYDIDVYGPLTEDQGKKMDEIISVLPHEVIHSVRWIFVDPGECLGDENCKIVGQFSPNDKVSVSYIYVNHKNVLIHEFAHAYHHQLDLHPLFLVKLMRDVLLLDVGKEMALFVLLS